MEFFLRRLTFSLLVCLTFALLINLGGCSVGSFIGAYFNTYYNAQKLFSEAEAEVLAPASALGGLRTERKYLSPFDVSAQSKTKFTSVIEKCSKLLQYHPESKLVDDALLMIGKSYYYQNEHQSAERKFKELLTSYPESDLALETRLLLAQTYYRNNEKNQSTAVALELLEEAKTENDHAIVGHVARLLAQLDLERRDFSQALTYFEVAAEYGETSEDRASAYRSVAEMYIQQVAYRDAAEAYAKSEEASSDYIGKFRGRMGYAKMLSNLGKHEESISQLEDLASNSNYREFFGDIDLEIADVYAAQQDFASAQVQYKYVDTAYARTEVAANSYYRLGLLYETKMFNYDSARAAYEKGKGEFPSAQITPELVRRFENLNRYFYHRTEIAKYDSIRNYILHPPDTTTITAVPGDTATTKSLASDSIAVDTTIARGIAKADSVVPKPPALPPVPMDTVQARLAFNKSELAGLFYSAMEIIDSASYWYNRLLLDHPESAYAPRGMYTLSQILRKDSTVASTTVDSIHREIVRRFPDSEFATESRRLLGLPSVNKAIDLTEVSYGQAESLVKTGDIASALRSLKGIAEKDSTSPISAKAQYTIGWIYENVKPNNDSSIANYERLVKRFPNSQYVALVQPKLSEVEMLKQKRLQEVELEKQRKAQEAQKDSLLKQQKSEPKAPDTAPKKLNNDAMPKQNLQSGTDSLTIGNQEEVTRKDPAPKKEEDPKP